MPVGATLGAAAIGGVGSIAGGLIQKSATDKAADTQTRMYEEGRSDLAPYREAGSQAGNMLLARLPDLTAPIKLDQNFLESTPGYQFALSQGLKSVQNSAAARGLASSGAALKGAATYATGLADQTYQNQFTNELAQRNQAANLLLQPFQVGSGAAATSSANANTAGANIGSTQVAGGNALAAGFTGAGNAASNGLSQYGGMQYANKLLGQGYAPNGFYKAA